MSDDSEWSDVPRTLTTVGLIIGALLLLMLAIAIGERAFRAYDRWECKQWCEPRGVAKWGSALGCECKP